MTTGRNPKRMWRVNQRAVRFIDRAKQADKDACRKDTDMYEDEFLESEYEDRFSSDDYDEDFFDTNYPDMDEDDEYTCQDAWRELGL